MVWDLVIPIIGREVFALGSRFPPIDREVFAQLGRDLLRYAGRDVLAFFANLVAAL